MNKLTTENSLGAWWFIVLALLLIFIGLVYSCSPSHAAEFKSSDGPGCDSPEAVIQLYSHLERLPDSTPLYIVIGKMAEYRQQGLMCEWLLNQDLQDMGEVTWFVRHSDDTVMSVIKWSRANGSPPIYSWRIAKGKAI